MKNHFISIAVLLDRAEYALKEDLPDFALEVFESAEAVGGCNLRTTGRGKRVYREIRKALAKKETCHGCALIREGLREIYESAVTLIRSWKKTF